MQLRRRAPAIREGMQKMMAGAEYIDLPEIKTVLLKDIFTDIVLFLYADPTLKEPIFRFAIDAGLKKGGRNFFAYHRSTLQKYFLKEIQHGDLFMRRVKKGEVYLLPGILEKCSGIVTPGPGGRHAPGPL